MNLSFAKTQNNIKNMFKQDCKRRTFFIVAAVLLCIKLLLANEQMIFITPLSAPIDDNLMYDRAKSILSGDWLGEYNWLTMSKYMFYPLYLALVNMLNIPYLLFGQLLYAFSCIISINAVSPIIKQYKPKLILLFLLLFNPAQTAAAVQLRIYRDNITSAFALLIFAGFIGLSLRYKSDIKKSLPYAVFAGIGIAASVLNREDGTWFLVFCIAVSLGTAIYIILDKDVKNKVIKIVLQIIPYMFLAVGILIFSLLNYNYYGRFIVSDFTSTEFNDACGAFMRVSTSEEFEQIDKIPVSSQALLAISNEVESFKPVYEKLNSFDIMRDYGAIDGNGEYNAGSFYWALRRSVYESGLADTAQEAQIYYTNLANEINTLCDDGVLPSNGGKISTSLTPFNIKYLLPTIQEGFMNLIRILTFSEAEPQFEKISISPPDLQAEYENFTKNASNISAKPHTDDAYYLPRQEFAYNVFDIIKYIISCLSIIAFVMAVFWQFSKITTKAIGENSILWWLNLGLLLSVLLRCFIVAYLFVTAFNDNVSRIAYLCAVHPAMLMFCFIGAYKAWLELRRRKIG